MKIRGWNRQGSISPHLIYTTPIFTARFTAWLNYDIIMRDVCRSSTVIQASVLMSKAVLMPYPPPGFVAGGRKLSRIISTGGSEGTADNAARGCQLGKSKD